MRKPAFAYAKTKTQISSRRGDREHDHRVCFCYTDNTIPPLPKYEISSLWPSFVTVQPGLCGTRSKTPKPVFSQRGSYDELTKYLFMENSRRNKVRI